MNSYQISISIMETVTNTVDSNLFLKKSTSDFNQNLIKCEPYSCNVNNSETFLDNTCGDTSEISSDSALREKYLNEIRPEKNEKSRKNRKSSTYNEIMCFLETLEQDLPDSLIENKPLKSEENSSNDVKELLMSTSRCNSFIDTNRHSSPKSQSCISNILKDDLEALTLQLEEKNEAIQVLKNELKTERKIACDKLTSQKRDHSLSIQCQKNKYQEIVKRHQKFIEQLILEKKDVTEKCNVLAQRIKDMETKHQRDMTVMGERHVIELRQAKELCAASEKIRRERWLEEKTSKIKEMTVRGLEPELKNMVEKHQQEINELKTNHLKELQDTEHRAIRRANKQLDEVRRELAEYHDKQLMDEKEAIKIRYQKKFEQQDELFQIKHQKLTIRLEEERSRISQELAEKDEQKEALLEKTKIEFQEKIDALNRKYERDKTLYEETLRLENESWMANFEQQQKIKMESAEAKFKIECSKERDRQIELAIERIEKETRNMKLSLQKTSENELRCVTEKFTIELQTSHNNEQLLNAKLEASERSFENVQTELRKTEGSLEKCIDELNVSRQLLDKLTEERDKAREIARDEIEMEKQELEEKVALLQHELMENTSNKDALMNRVYSRIKLVVAQKDSTIKNLTKEIDNLKQKCEHLDKLLDQQRREYILKSL